MERASSLGEYSGGAPQQAARSRVVGGEGSSSGAVVAGRRVYAFDHGFCLIPRDAWIKGLERRPGAPFHVTQFRHSIIIPASDTVPHLTLDTQETYFLHKMSPPCMKVRISDVHYTQGNHLPRQVFYCHGVQLVPDGQFDKSVLRKVQRYLERSSLPFRLPPELLLTEQTQAASIAPVMAVEEVEPTASSSASGGASAQLEELFLEEQELADSPTSSTPPKRKGHRAHGSKHKALKKSAAERPAKQAKAAKEDIEKIWLDTLDLDNVYEALETFTVYQLSDEELKYAVLFYRLGFQNMRAMIQSYSDKIKERSSRIVDAMARSVELLVKAKQERGARRSRYQQAAKQAVTVRNIEECKALPEGEDPASMGVLDYKLHELKPTDFLAERVRPSSEELAKFRGYKCAMLLLFKMQAVRCSGMRCREFFLKASHLCLHIEGISNNLDPVLKQYFSNLRTYLFDAQKAVTAGAAAWDIEGKELSIDEMKRHQDLLEPFQSWHEKPLQMFYHFTCVLVDISRHLPGVSGGDLQELLKNTADEPRAIAAVNVEDPDHWEEASDSLEYVRNRVVESGASTSTSTSTASSS